MKINTSNELAEINTPTRQVRLFFISIDQQLTKIEKFRQDETLV